MNRNNNPNQQQQQQLQQRLYDLQQEQARIQQQLAVQQFAANYPITFAWPAQITGHRRTEAELLQHRLLEAGFLYDVPISTSDAVEAASRFIHNLQATDCFHSVNVELGKGGKGGDVGEDEDSSDSSPSRTIYVHVHEKNWYKLHAGAGLKTDMMDRYQLSTNAFLPSAEVELSVGLRNVMGCLDTTSLQYGIDTHNIGTWKLTHDRPLYKLIPNRSLSDLLLEQELGSQYAFSGKLALDTVDLEYVSSYKVYQRYLSMRISTAALPSPQPSTQQSPSAAFSSSFEWLVNYRDVCPRRHPTRPYQLVAAPEIVRNAGSSVKHGLLHTMHYDQTVSGDPSGLPTAGTQWQWTNEVATPPGDTGFVKTHGAVAHHLPLSDSTTIHASIHTGYLHQLSFGGLCDTSICPADKFLLGGVGSFRGFVPAGIGPRSRSHNSKDALGGNFKGTGTIMMSTSVGKTSINSLDMLTQYIRLFGFVQAGTCANIYYSTPTSMLKILNSCRVSAGIGWATHVLGPRVEMTYAWPLRYGPQDGRRRFQLGVAFSI